MSSQCLYQTLLYEALSPIILSLVPFFIKQEKKTGDSVILWCSKILNCLHWFTLRSDEDQGEADTNALFQFQQELETRCVQ